MHNWLAILSDFNLLETSTKKRFNIRSSDFKPAWFIPNVSYITQKPSFIPWLTFIKDLQPNFKQNELTLSLFLRMPRIIEKIPPNRSATAPVRRPPTISITRTSEFAVTLAKERRRDKASNRKNLNQMQGNRYITLILFPTSNHQRVHDAWWQKERIQTSNMKCEIQLSHSFLGDKPSKWQGQKKCRYQ